MFHVSIYLHINVVCVIAANYQFAIHMLQTKNAHSKKQILGMPDLSHIISRVFGGKNADNIIATVNIH